MPSVIEWKSNMKTPQLPLHLLLLGLVASLLMTVSLPSYSDSNTTGKFLGAQNTEYPSWFKSSFLEFADDIEEAAEEGKRLAIIFHQDGCPYCNLLIEKNLSQQDIKELMQTKLDVVELNIWGSREVVSVAGKTYAENDFAKALNIQYTPTVLFFNEEGKVALRLNGYREPAEFKRALEYVTGKYEKTQSYSQYIAANRITKSNESLNTQDFFDKAPYDLSLPKAGFDKPVAVFFEQTNCPNCDKFHTVNLAKSDTQNIIKQFKNIQLDMWSDTPVTTPDGETTTARKWAEKLGVTYAPSVVFFGKDGQEVIRLEAMFKAFHTASSFDYVLSEAYKTQPSLQNYITERAEHIREQGNDVNLWD